MLDLTKIPMLSAIPQIRICPNMYIMGKRIIKGFLGVEQKLYDLYHFSYNTISFLKTVLYEL